jgi:DNA-binding NtrC family response regulator
MRILIIGDLDGNMINAAKIAKEKQAKVLCVTDINSAMITLRNGKNINAIFIDSEMDIASLSNRLKEEHFSVPIISCGTSKNQKRGVESIKEGAIEYILLPPNKEAIAALLASITNDSSDDKIIYRSKNFSKVIELSKQVAPSTANILISGESGVGKEIIAKYIHNNSDRADKELISINCAAIPEQLLESELFGHERGAFTGAIEKRIGKFEEANNSTLFLDEISEMDVKLQAKLLRAIQEKEIIRVGGNTPIKLNIRILATSNKCLLEEVKNGNFRGDLFYRLNVVNIHIPPLRDRVEDIKPLVEYFINKYCELNTVHIKKIDQAAIKKLENYNWPGNIRELENSIHRAVLISKPKQISEEDITLIDIEEGIGTLAIMEEKMINKAMFKYDKNHEIVSKVLGISIKLLKDKLKNTCL